MGLSNAKTNKCKERKKRKINEEGLILRGTTRNTHTHAHRAQAMRHVLAFVLLALVFAVAAANFRPPAVPLIVQVWFFVIYSR
jgi:hypothetical protein